MTVILKMIIDFFQCRGGSVKAVHAPLCVMGLPESVEGNADRDIALRAAFPQPGYPLNQTVRFEGVGGKVNVGETQRVDYVLCTHNHIDHLNLETILPLARTNPQTKFVVPAPCKSVLTGAGIANDRVIAARAGEDLVLSGDITLASVPAIHTLLVQEQGEKDENGDYTSLGFILKGEGLLIYHAGDTWVTPSLIKALKALGPLNIAMLPINGTDWKRTEENCIGNMNPLDAVKLTQAIPIDMVFPSHYDMIAHNSENPARFVDSMYALCPEKRFHIFAPGECFIYR